MSDIQKEIATAEEFEKNLTFQFPIPISWAVWEYKALLELIELKESEYQSAINKVNVAAKLAREYQDENRQLRDALKHYADENSWCRVGLDWCYVPELLPWEIANTITSQQKGENT